jgi:sigma-B regulation protein RsbU (phosphoserine phosphatase)
MLRLPAGGGAPECHGAEGVPVAFVPGVEYEQRTLQLAPGDRLYLYSDGVPEAMDPEKQPYGEQTMADRIAAARGQPLEASVTGLLESVEKWCNPVGPLDDITILGIEWRP